MDNQNIKLNDINKTMEELDQLLQPLSGQGAEDKAKEVECVGRDQTGADSSDDIEDIWNNNFFEHIF